MTNIKVEVRTEEDENYTSYILHISSDDKSIWAHGELNFITTKYVAGKEKLIEQKLSEIADEIYAGVE